MVTTKLSSKGQIVIPSAIRKQHHWEFGQSLVIEDTADGVLLREANSASDVRKLVGIADYNGERKTLSDMDEAVRKGVLERHGRD